MLQRIVFAAVIVIACAQALRQPPKWHQLHDGYTFETYKQDFGKEYPERKEHEMRRGLFQQRLREAMQHNSDPHKTWKKGINRMSDWSESELAEIRGGRIQPSHTSKFKKTLVKQDKMQATLPPSFDWRDIRPNVMTAPKDQGRCGDCWAHAVTETIESAYAIKTGDLFDLSVQQITSCTPKAGFCYSCHGSFPQLGYDYATEHGITEEYVYGFQSWNGSMPGCWTGWRAPSRLHNYVNISGYIEVSPNNQADTMEALANLGPVSITVDASRWSSYESGIFDSCNFTRNITIDHVVQLVGYGTQPGNSTTPAVDYWIVRNSWSAAWGEHGYIRLAKPNPAPCGWNVGAISPIGCYNDGPRHVWSCGMCGLLYTPLWPTL